MSTYDTRWVGSQLHAEECSFAIFPSVWKFLTFKHSWCFPVDNYLQLQHNYPWHNWCQLWEGPNTPYNTSVYNIGNSHMYLEMHWCVLIVYWQDDISEQKTNLANCTLTSRNKSHTTPRNILTMVPDHFFSIVWMCGNVSRT